MENWPQVQNCFLVYRSAAVARAFFSAGAEGNCTVLSKFGSIAQQI